MTDEAIAIMRLLVVIAIWIMGVIICPTVETVVIAFISICLFIRGESKQ